jgi:arabinofuranosyltransferase
MVRQLWAFSRHRLAFASAVLSGGSLTASDEGTERDSGLRQASRAQELLPLLGVCLYAIAIVKNGWLADDAFASLRAAANLVNGHGLLSNPPERVQAFTNPLWTLLFALGYWPAKDAYAVAILLGLGCSLAAAGFVAVARRKGSRDQPEIDAFPRAVGVLALCLSTAFVDFSTSGLENPLSHLLIVCIYVCARGGSDTLVIALLSALLAVNRLDHLLLFVPLLAARLFRAGRVRFRRELGRMALGFLPLALWELFALVYYGFPLPNTAYAKLNSTIKTSEFMSQGLLYFVESATRDPLTVVVIVAGIFAPFVTRSFRVVPFAIGVALYAFYVLYVGGDFMAGRFLTAPFVLAVVLLFHDIVPALPSRLDLAAGAVVVLVPLAAQSSPLGDTGAPVCPVPESGVTDERDCYRAHTGLIANVRATKYKKHEYYELGVGHRRKGAAVYAKNVVGLEGFAAGPKVHLIDQFGLTDPLLARIPFEPPDRSWRIGHFYRTPPDGYVESVRTGKNLLKDPCLARYYERLRRVTHGPIWSWSRFEDIFWLNFKERTTAACR